MNHKRLKKPTLWISSCPSHIVGAVQRDQFRALVYSLAQISSVVPWAIDLACSWSPNDKTTRSYRQRMEIVEIVDLVVALYPTNDGSDTRHEEVRRRIDIEKPILFAKHSSVNFSEFFAGMFEEESIKFEEFHFFPDLIHPIQTRLREIQDQ